MDPQLEEVRKRRREEMQRKTNNNVQNNSASSDLGDNDILGRDLIQDIRENIHPGFLQGREDIKVLYWQVIVGGLATYFFWTNFGSLLPLILLLGVLLALLYKSIPPAERHKIMEHAKREITISDTMKLPVWKLVSGLMVCIVILGGGFLGYVIFGLIVWQAYEKREKIREFYDKVSAERNNAPAG